MGSHGLAFEYKNDTLYPMVEYILKVELLDFYRETD